MIHYKTKEEIELLRQSSLLVSKTLAEVAKIIRPGLSSIELDRVAEEYIQDHRAEPAFKGYLGFPNCLCISVNEQVVHGIPSKKELKPGDVVSVDCGVKLNGYFGDSAYTFAIGDISQKVEQLLTATKESLFVGIEYARAGNRVGDISYAIQHYIERERNYFAVRELVGHGIGKELHEDPEVPNYGKRGTGAKMKEGLVIAIEPMVNMGTKKVIQLDDKWTIKTADDSISAHYELMVAIQKEEADILSTFSFIEEEEAKNIELKRIKSYKEILAD